MNIEATRAASKYQGERHKELVEAMEARWGKRNGQEIRNVAELLWLLIEAKAEGPGMPVLQTVISFAEVSAVKAFSENWAERNGGKSPMDSDDWPAIEKEITTSVKALITSKHEVYRIAGIA